MNDSDKSGRPSIDRGSSPSPMSTTSNGHRPAGKAQETDEQTTSIQGTGERARPSSRLSSSLIQNILAFLEPETFLRASTLDHKWHDAAETRESYLSQISRHYNNGNYNDLIDGFQDKSFRDLKRLLLQLTRRQRQRKQYKRQIWNLVAPSTASSTISPHGESFRITFSAKGHMALASSSSRIFVLNVTGDAPTVVRAFQVQRRPQCCIITDDGSFLVVLSSDWKVHSYHLRNDGIMLGKSMFLDGPTKTIAMSPDRTLLAAAHSDFIELQSLAEDSPNGVRRRLPCQGIVSLTFSTSGMMLLGTTKDYRQHLTTLVSAPMQTGFDPETGVVEQQRLDQLWTSQLLFPNIFRDCGHAALIPDWYEGEISRVFGYDGPAESFGLLNIEKYQFQGQTFHEAPISKGEPQKCPTLPAIDADGTRMAIARGRQVHIHSIPSIDLEEDEAKVKLLYKVSHSGNAISRLQWVFVGPHDTIRQRDRLIAALKGRRNSEEESEDDASLDKAQLMVLDFKSSDAGVDHETTLELDSRPIEILEEDDTDIEEELAVQSRVGAARADGTLLPKGGMRRSVTSGRQHGRRRSGQGRRSSSQIHTPISEDGTPEPMEDPYSHNAPRPAPQLARAATVAAVAPRFRPSTDTPRLRIPGDRSEIPDESDADNWIPPPPPYERQPEEPIPEEVSHDQYSPRTAHPSASSPEDPAPLGLGLASNVSPHGSDVKLPLEATMRRPYPIATPSSPAFHDSTTINGTRSASGTSPVVSAEHRSGVPSVTSSPADQVANASLHNRSQPHSATSSPVETRGAFVPTSSTPGSPLEEQTSAGVSSPSAGSTRGVKRVLTKTRKQEAEPQSAPNFSRPRSPPLTEVDVPKRRMSGKYNPLGRLSFAGGPASETPVSDTTKPPSERKLSLSRSATSLGSSSGGEVTLPAAFMPNGDVPPVPVVAPSEAQLASLNRRQDSLPHQLIRSRSNSAPRGASGAHRMSWNNGSNEFLPHPPFRQSSYGSPYAASPAASSTSSTPRTGTPLGMHHNGSTSSFKQSYTQRLGTIEDTDTHVDDYPAAPSPPPSPGQSHRKRMSGGYATTRRTRLSSVIGSEPSDPSSSADLETSQAQELTRSSEDGGTFGHLSIVRESPYAHDLSSKEPSPNRTENRDRERPDSRSSLRVAVQNLKQRASASRLREAMGSSSQDRLNTNGSRGENAEQGGIGRQRSRRIAKSKLGEVGSTPKKKKRDTKCIVM